jgi:uncharacterized protein with PIN domain
MVADQPSSFVVESTLGRLCKWLRMAGWDALFDSGKPDANRLAAMDFLENRHILTRTQKVYNALGPNRALLIDVNSPLDQIRHVIKAYGLRYDQINPLTRCLQCNCQVQSCSARELSAEIPEHIIQIHRRFHQCPQCQRIFWSGSHAARCKALIDTWFAEKLADPDTP